MERSRKELNSLWIYGKKDKEQKAEIIQAFKEGEKKIIVATKAFGMGVDISDIDRVYHVAPSSTFVDYIQEIGRAARDKNITGVAVTDFNERDFYYMKRDCSNCLLRQVT